MCHGCHLGVIKRLEAKSVLTVLSLTNMSNAVKIILMICLNCLKILTEIRESKIKYYKEYSSAKKDSPAFKRIRNFNATQQRLSNSQGFAF